MAPTPNPRVIYKAVPKEYPIPGEHLVYESDSASIDLDNVDLHGGALVRTVYISLDPYLRGTLRDPSVQSYRAANPLGKPMKSRTISKVIRSEDPDFKSGDYVLSLSSDWSLHAVLTKANGLSKLQKPTNASLSTYAGVLGMPGLTAFLSLRAFGRLKAGETLFVSTAAGVVGSVVAQLAKLAGLKVIGSTGDDSKVEWLKEELKLDVAFNYKTTKVADVLREHGPIDIYYDNVGGETLDVAFQHINKFGRVILCGFASEYNKGDRPSYGIKNLSSQTISKTLSINGFVISDITDKEGLDAFEKEYRPLVEKGQIKYQETRYQGLEKTPEAFLAMFKGQNFGKTVVVVSDE
ncbi:uncharacterized protein EI90DRAFT_2968806 [Cantharellus anzutake]|uniref:uncharacterized protein n=1 Tax=Cantharellus anzutake TaxID=1750568 RepID=UPI001906403E|nr:uncharacterized protein EI90DRAFT_2968806 [Cantharellus anzutake]KAF8337057.1 hypothetical protein EI90DRAFT_2968806 [Cantharellus anzutake]